MTEALRPKPEPAGVTWMLDGAVASITLDLLQPKNAFRISDAHAVSARLDEAVAAGARCIVLRGAGPVFSAGWDITSIRPGLDDPAAMIEEVVGPLCRKLRDLPLPTIAAVAGPALGFGFGLALCCDIVLAEESALLGSPFHDIGMVPDSGTHFFLRDRLGHARAAEMLYTGRLVSGTEAAQAGLINRAVQPGTLVQESDSLAAKIASGPTAALRLSKRILLAGGDFHTVLKNEAGALRECFATADLKEGLQAFVQRRKPQFTGR